MSANTEKTKSDLIVAAGGLLWREPTTKRELAIVHRKKYDDWSLPKGKLEQGESIGGTARREVQEETGCEIDLQGFAGIVQYSVDGVPKIIYFWNMRVIKESAYKLHKDVDKVEWVTPEEAIERIQYAEEKKLLGSLLDVQQPSEKPVLLQIGRVFMKRAYERILGSLKSYRVELDNRICRFTHEDKQKHLCLVAARELLEKAELLLNDNKIDAAWKCFLSAQRTEVFCLDERELEIKATILRHEADKLGSWRKGAVEDLLGTPTQPKKEIGAKHIYEALQVRDEHFHNQAYKDGIIRTHVVFLVATLVTTLVTLVLLAANERLDIGAKQVESDWQMLINS